MRALLKLVAIVMLAGASTLCSASLFLYTTALDGASETPSNASTATGFASILLDDVLNTLQVDVDWSGLTGGNPSAAHIHCCTPPGTNVGVAVGFPGFPATTTGTYSHLFDLLDSAIYTAAFRNNFGGGTAAGAEAALIAGLNAGTSYVNIHNATFPGGEIRGFPAQVPEPATLALLGVGVAMLGWSRRRR